MAILGVCRPCHDFLLVFLINPVILRGSVSRISTLPQEVNISGIDFRAEAQIAITVGILFEPQSALDVNLPALCQIFMCSFSLAPPRRYAEPYRVLFGLA